MTTTLVLAFALGWLAASVPPRRVLRAVFGGPVAGFKRLRRDWRATHGRCEWCGRRPDTTSYCTECEVQEICDSNQAQAARP